ncbi:MAG: hypothetical protein O2923_02295 [Verrucomicrobia bacterium]|nr:hypothetical protein [Verrucomicrobiota bacterium]
MQCISELQKIRDMIWAIGTADSLQADDPTPKAFWSAAACRALRSKRSAKDGTPLSGLRATPVNPIATPRA